MTIAERSAKPSHTLKPSTHSHEPCDRGLKETQVENPLWTVFDTFAPRQEVLMAEG